MHKPAGIIALDLDGTLLNSNKELTQRSYDALAAAAAKGEYESLKASAEGYRASFRKLVEDQLEALKANDILFK